MPSKEAVGDVSHGIQDLIDTLRQDGVVAGREEGQRIVSEAETRAEWIIEQAREEVQQIRQKADAEAEYIRQAGRESLELAYRDTLLKLKDQLLAQFSDNLRRLVSQQLSGAGMLGELIIALAGQTRLPEGRASIDLPEAATADDSEHADMLTGDALVGFVSGVTSGMLREGVELKTGRHGAGLVIHLGEGDVRIDLTDEAVCNLLLDSLQPRFRALLEGVEA